MNRSLALALPAYHHVSFDGVPTFRALAWALQDARNNGWNGCLVSSDRRVSVIKEHNARFHTNLHDQAYLSDGWLKRLPGFNPANPPTQGTHLLLGDGVVGSVGEHLDEYRLGLDVTEWDQLLAILRRLGYSVYQPYSSGSEKHHIGFHTSPATRARRRLAVRRAQGRKTRPRP